MATISKQLHHPKLSKSRRKIPLKILKAPKRKKKRRMMTIAVVMTAANLKRKMTRIAPTRKMIMLQRSTPWLHRILARTQLPTKRTPHPRLKETMTRSTTLRRM